MMTMLMMISALKPFPAVCATKTSNHPKKKYNNQQGPSGPFFVIFLFHQEKNMQILLWIFLCFSSLSLLAQDCQREERVFSEANQFFLQTNYQSAAQLYSQLKHFGAEKCNHGFSASYFQTVSFYRMKNVSAFEVSANDLILRARSDADKEKILLLRSYVYEDGELKGVNDDLARRWSAWSARKEKQFPEKLQLADLSDAAQVMEIHQKLEGAVHSKSPWVAGLLATALPGAGHAYLGSWSSAALSLAVNALLLGTTLEFNQRNMDFAAATSGVAFSLSYLGNILSAVQGAQALNAQTALPWENRLRQTLLPELEF
jgi:hypothetical protein